MLVDQLPFISPLLKTVSFAYKHGFLVTVLQHNVYFLHCAGDAHVAVYNNVCFENVNFAGFEIVLPFGARCWNRKQR